ncbi:hypothetical protein AUSSIE_4 [Sinorhizobium phage Aussie]|nr:hypothetical protein AUSSIE_4 [Sinorhizobium phage Aussie]
MIIKPRLDQPETKVHGIAPGLARMFEEFGFVFERVEAPVGADRRGEQRP